MRLILSRKGFDSSAGGCPSPIFPDGSLYPLPIPDTKSDITYGEIQRQGVDIGALVEHLTRGRYSKLDTAHLDPDMFSEALPRSDGWRPLLGQTGAAQGHLRRQKITVGDLFLYFGLFRPVEQVQGRWQFVRKTPAQHVLWGWMAIGDIRPVDELDSGQLPWARYHPHFRTGPDRANTLYLAADTLTAPRQKRSVPGAGVFPRIAAPLILTAPDSTSPSLWQLPDFFYPGSERTPLSYHNKAERWRREENDRQRGFCQLQSAARGQEFVLDMNEYPESHKWINDLIREFGQATVAPES